MPAWSQLMASAPTLLHDIAILGDTGAGKPLPIELAKVLAPVLARQP